jgi:hypothetical protein
MDLVMDLSKTGLDMFFKPYQITALNILWRSSEPLSSRQVWKQANTEMTETISRASIINFLNASVDFGLLTFDEVTGKGGYHRIYSPKLSKFEAKAHITKIVNEHLQTLPT